MSDLLHCCGSRKWAEAITAAGPFENTAALLRASDEIFTRLDIVDLLEAFHAHPRIGEKSSSAWSQQEQSGAAAAAASQTAKLHRLNRAYEDRYGYIFIICATGKTMDHFLDALRSRLNNAPDVEIQIAAEQQRQITRLRLQKLLSQSS